MPLLIMVVCGAIAAFTAWHVESARTVELRNSQTETSNLARALADHAQATMDTANILLAGLVERVEVGGVSPAQLMRLQTVMSQKVAAPARVRDLFVFGVDGAAMASSVPVDPFATAVDREYFAWHRDHADRGPHLGPPVRGRHNQRWTATVSRRIDSADGNFAGVVVATIDIETLRRFYESFDVGPHGAIALAAEDGTLLARQPELPGTIGTRKIEPMRPYYEGGPVGQGATRSVLDGVLRYYSFHKVDHFPLVVFVSRSSADILAQWRRDSAAVVVTAAAIIVLLCLLAWRLRQQIMQRQRTEASLARSEELHRMLAESSTDLIVRTDAAHRRTYVSPASMSLLGYEPEEMLALSVSEMVYSEDWPSVSAFFAAVDGGDQAASVAYRGRRKDGSLVWLEASGRSLGPNLGAIASIRNISARKRIEDELHDANKELERIAMQDGLTGIANRRAFEKLLAKEVQRGYRNQTPLAALLVDIDHFKAFNDRYGHPAGDDCLRSVARGMAAEIRRPADLVARYGGEEFVILLPETEQVGAMHCAKKLLAAMEGLSIPHAASAHRHVTVSIGVAVLSPTASEKAAGQLIEAADAALYAAKRGGRACAYFAEDDPDCDQAALRLSAAPDPVSSFAQSTSCSAVASV